VSQQTRGTLVELFPRGNKEAQAGYIYLIRAIGTELVKVGYTYTSPRERLLDLQIGSPLPLELILGVYVANPAKIEKRIHRKFATYRHHGEWFCLPEQILQAFALLMELFTEGDRLLHAPNRRKCLSGKQQSILAVLTIEPQPIDEVMHRLNLTTKRQQETLRITLWRMVCAGDIRKPARGYYALSPQIKAEEG
jgi:hypothetical protein